MGNLNPNLVPDGFLHQARTTIASIFNDSLFLSDRTKAVFNGFSGENFIEISKKIPLIADATCRPDFALAVKAHSEGPDNWLINYLSRDPERALV